MTTMVERLQEYVEATVKLAQKMGYNGDPRDYSCTEADCEAIAECLDAAGLSVVTRTRRNLTHIRAACVAHDEAETYHECAYCGAETADATVPPTDDDAAWEDIARHHAGWCEWATTRAHRR